MPSAIITVEEIYDNILFGTDDLTAVSIAVISAEDILGAVGDESLAVGIANITANELTLFVAEDATVIAIAEVSAEATGQVFVEVAIVTSVATATGDESAAYVDALPVSSFSSTSSFNVISGADRASATGVAAPSAIARLDFLDTSRITVLTGPVAAEAVIFTQIGLGVAIGISSALDAAGFVDSVTTAASSTQLVAQEVYTSGGNTLNTYTDADISLGHAVPTASDGKEWIDITVLSTTAAPSASVDNHGVSDAAMVTAFQAISGLNTLTYSPDIATITASGAPSATATVAYLDASTMASHTVLPSQETTPLIDADTITAISIPSASELSSRLAVLDTFQRNPVTSGWGTPSDRGNPWAVSTAVAADFSTDGTVGKIYNPGTTVHVASLNIDDPTGMSGSKYNIGQLVTWQWDKVNPANVDLTMGGLITWYSPGGTYYHIVVTMPSTSTALTLLGLKRTTVNTTIFNPVVYASSSINTNYSMRIETSNLDTLTPTLNARFWIASSPEPTTWTASYTDTSGSLPTLRATYGFKAAFTGITTGINFKVSSYEAYYL